MSGQDKPTLPYDFLEQLARQEVTHIERLHPVDTSVIISTVDGRSVRLNGGEMKAGYGAGLRHGILMAVRALEECGLLDDMSVLTYEKLLQGNLGLRSSLAEKDMVKLLTVDVQPSEELIRLEKKKAFIRRYLLAARNSGRSRDIGSEREQQSLVDTASKLYDKTEAVKS